MRNAFVTAMRRLYAEQRFAFLTGDLGFNALEMLRDDMKQDFINAGIAEQNMVTTAAGIVKSGLPTWCYSIAPFLYARAFEQIRNDVCLNRLPVKLVGNGGGYGYGVMGPSHHALEDYGTLLGLQGMVCYVPAFAEDVDPCVRLMADSPLPGYLRLGKCEMPAGLELPAFGAWRKVLDGSGTICVVVGPIAGGLAERIMAMPVLDRPELWVLSVLRDGLQLPFAPDRRVVIVEEHVRHGSVGDMLASQVLLKRQDLTLMYADGYPSGKYGSQGFHRRECGLDVDNILAQLGAI